ncbi:SGNH/GDSL hydrolase family protein [Salinibacterium sp. G-O1]|uniref:SGNH/GDSL hydrolase family protein n=1 Tax=Salinibacterium sp. G-O1 TaxID=3046208 RepID=UPI0024BAD288|nr:SGNH/GDSL hydrolase family protein [Salinibacterium sp. G-O1]MDJ0334060.1 SGNH/GDSL hydrolase family protein [Salinibacterium sp. G-O1]
MTMTSTSTTTAPAGAIHPDATRAASGLVDIPLVGGPLTIRGAVWIEPTERGIFPRRYLPPAAHRFVDEFMRATMSQSAGIRIAFRTAARQIELRVLSTRLADFVDAPPTMATYDICANGEVVSTASSDIGTRLVLVDRNLSAVVAGGEAILNFALDGQEREYELWLPYADEVELRGFRADAPVLASSAPSRPRWVHHGSSISHGYVASRTTRTWPTMVAQASDLELVNLSYAGNAMLDQSTARTIRDTPAAVISVKLGINVVNGDVMRLRAFRSAVHGFLDTIRDGHPDTPLLVISPVCCPPVETTPGPTVRTGSGDTAWFESAGSVDDVAAGKLSLQVIRRELADIVAHRFRHDPHIGYLDGSDLYGTSDNLRQPMPDNLHPADDVNELIAERFAAAAFGANGWTPRSSL